jgi:hypothetical protein
MNDDARSSHFGWLRVELEDTTLDEARFYFDAVEGVEVPTRGGEIVGTVVKTQRDLSLAEARDLNRRRRDEHRYWGD